MRISSPPTTHSCFYGIDTPERGKLLAARHSVDEMADADRRRQPGLHLASTASIARCGQAGRDAAAPQYCDACFTGEYPIPLPDASHNDNRQLSLLTELR